MRSSPSLYEGAFRLETTARPSDMFSSSLQATMMIGHLGGGNVGNGGKENGDDDGGSPLSSPVDDSSYKIRIGPRGSSSPTSHDDEDHVGGVHHRHGGEGKMIGGSEMDTEAQDLSMMRGGVADEGVVDEDEEGEDGKRSGYPSLSHLPISGSKLNFEDENSMQ